MGEIPHTIVNRTTPHKNTSSFSGEYILYSIISGGSYSSVPARSLNS